MKDLQSALAHIHRCLCVYACERAQAGSVLWFKAVPKHRSCSIRACVLF